MTRGSVLAEHVLQAIESGELDKFAGPELRQLDRILCDALATLRSVPNQWQANIRIDTNPAAFGPPGQPLRLVAGALEDVDATLGFVAHGNAYKLAALVEDAVDGLNRKRFTVAISATRAVIETYAAIAHSTRKLKPQLEALFALTPSMLAASTSVSSSKTYSAALQTILAAMSKLRAQPQLTKWNWLVFTGEALAADSKKVPPGLEQVNVLTAIDALKFSRAYGDRTPRIFYDALCDCVHPNRDSYMLFMETCETTETMWRPLLRAQPSHRELTLFALSLMAVPLQELVPVGIDIIGNLLAWHKKVIEIRVGLRAYL
jgi:hypothetical protein